MNINEKNKKYKRKKTHKEDARKWEYENIPTILKDYFYESKLIFEFSSNEDWMNI